MYKKKEDKNMMTKKLLEVYEDGYLHSNAEVYQILHATDDYTKHLIRSLQQHLKKSGKIENFAYGYWQLTI